MLWWRMCLCVVNKGGLWVTWTAFELINSSEEEEETNSLSLSQRDYIVYIVLEYDRHSITQAVIQGVVANAMERWCNLKNRLVCRICLYLLKYI